MDGKSVFNVVGFWSELKEVRCSLDATGGGGPLIFERGFSDSIEVLYDNESGASFSLFKVCESNNLSTNGVAIEDFKEVTSESIGDPVSGDEDGLASTLSDDVVSS